VHEVVEQAKNPEAVAANPKKKPKPKNKPKKNSKTLSRR